MNAQLAPSAPTSITQYAPGIHLDVPAEVYHRKELGVVNCGALKQLAQTPAHYRAWLADTEDKETPAKNFGRALHCAVLEPELFEATYIIARDHPFRRVADRNRNAKNPSAETIKACAYWDAWAREMGDKIEISHDDAIVLRGIQQSVKAHPIASKLFTGGVAEATVVWTDPQTGLLCKARLDYYIESRGLCVDLKSTEDASPAGFAKSVANYTYHVQHSHYSDGMLCLGKPLRAFLFVAVEKTPPYAVAVHCINDEAEARGQDLRRRGMDTINDSLKADSWPGYAPTIHTLALPRWALND